MTGAKKSRGLLQQAPGRDYMRLVGHLYGNAASRKRLDVDEVRRAASGRWADILPALGVDAAHLTGRHGPCPHCGGRDRFRFTDTNRAGEPVGAFICSPSGNGCGTGDGFDLLQRVNGYGFIDALREVAGYLGIAESTTTAAPRPSKAQREALLHAANVVLVAAADVREGRSWSDEDRATVRASLALLLANPPQPVPPPNRPVHRTPPDPLLQIRDQVAAAIVEVRHVLG